MSPAASARGSRIASRPCGLDQTESASTLPSMLIARTGRFLSRSISSVFCGAEVVRVSVAVPSICSLDGKTSIARSTCFRCSAARAGSIGPPDALVILVIGGSPGSGAAEISAVAQAARSRRSLMGTSLS